MRLQANPPAPANLNKDQRRVVRARNKVLKRLEAQAGSDAMGRRLLGAFRELQPDEFGQLSKQDFVAGLRDRYRVDSQDVRAKKKTEQCSVLSMGAPTKGTTEFT